MYGDIIVDKNKPCRKALIDNRLIKKVSVDGNDIIYETDTTIIAQNFYKSGGSSSGNTYTLNGTETGQLKSGRYFRNSRFLINFTGSTSGHPVKQSVFFYVYTLEDGGENNPFITIEAFPELYYLNKYYYRLKVTYPNGSINVPNSSTSGLINNQSSFEIVYENGHIYLKVYDAEQGNGTYDLGAWDYNKKPLLLKIVHTGNSAQNNIVLNIVNTSGTYIANYNTTYYN